MNLKHLLTLVGLCLSLSLSGQIKIGDNPQNLDAASVLELESNDRVLVITRISEAQMNALTPLAGAMVYNNDAQCIFYFDGTAWINLCDSLSLNFTTDPIVNSASTIVITENGDDVNFEVGEISSENILDFSISSIDIQNNSITADKLAPDSVGSEELQDNTVTDAEIDYNIVTLNDFFNDAGYITAANIVSGNANNAITDNGGAFYDDSQLVADVATNAAAIAADNDGNPTNEIQSLSINADQLTITGGNTITIPTADGSDTNIQGGTNINVTGIGTAGNPYIVNNTFTEVDASTSNELQDLQFNATTNILTISNPATPGNQVDLTSLAGGGGTTELADQVTIVGSGAAGNEFEVADGSISSIKIVDGTVMPVDLANNAVETAKILDANVTPVKIAPSAINNQVLTTVANTVVWADLPPGTGTDDQQITDFSLNNATNVLSVTIEDGNTQTVDLSSLSGGGGTDDQDLLGATLSPANVLQIDIENGNSATVDLSSLAVGGGTDDQTAAEVSFTPTGNTVSVDVQAAIEELQTEIDGISAGGAANPNDELITSFTLTGTTLNILEAGNPFPLDLGPTFATDAELAAAIAADGDTDDQNELQNLSEVLSEGADANATIITNLADPLAAQDAATKAYVDAQVGGVVVSADVPNSITAGTDGGALYDDPDNDAANEIQDLSEVLTEGADANASIITNLADPIAAQDAATKAYVDAQVGGVVVSSDVPNSIVAGTDGGALYDDPDNDATNEIQDLAEVLTEGADANATIITNLADPVAAQDAATKAYVDANVAGHTGTVNSIFFADALGVPIDNGNQFYWDPAGRTFTGGSTGALYVGIDGNNQSDKTKLHIGEDLDFGLAYPLQLQNFGQGGGGGTSVGMLFSVDDLDTHGKGALVYDRTLSNSRGDFHFLQNTGTNTNNPVLGDAVVTIKNDGDMGIGTITPAEKLHVNGNFQLDGNLIAQNGAGNLNDVLTITAAGTEWAPAAAANDNQTAAEVPYDNTLSGFTSTNTQDVIDEIITNIPLDDQTAAEVSYDNTLSGLTAGNAQDAIDEIVANTPLDDQTAAEVSYDNTLSGLTAITTQAAIDEIVANIPADDQNASEVAVAATPTNYTAGSADVEAHLAGIDAALAGGGGANLSNTNLTQAAEDRIYSLNGQNLAFTGLGSIGIGNAAATPSHKLHVAGAIRSESGFLSSDGNANEPAFRFTSDTNTGMYRAAADELSFTTGGFEAIRIDDNQNVGVGTTAPTSTLVTGGSFATAIETINGNTTLDENDHTIILDGNHTINLPNASTCQGRVYIIKNPNGTTSPISSYVDNTGGTVSLIPAQSALWIQSDGTSWQQIN